MILREAGSCRVLFAGSILAAALSVVGVGQTSGQDVRFEPTSGPEGGVVVALTAAPDGTLYAAGWGAESRWHILRPVVAPLFRRLPGSTTWERMGDVSGGVLSLEVADDGTLYAGTSSGLRRSVDFGANWHLISPGNVEVASLARDDIGVLSATSAGLSRYREDTSTWENLALEGTALAQVATHQGAVAVVSRQGTVFLSEGGGSFLPIRSDHAGPILRVAFHPDGSLWVQASDGDSSRTLFSLDDSDSLVARSFPSILNTTPRHLSVRADGTIYVGLGRRCDPSGCGERGGLYRSVDSGGSWTPLGLDEWEVWEVALDADQVLVAAAMSPDLTQVSPARSSPSPGLVQYDALSSAWTPAGHGLATGQVRHLATGPSGVVVASAGYAIQLSGDGGDSWSTIWSGFPDVLAGPVTVCPDGAVHAFLGTSLHSRLDGGSWTLRTLPPISDNRISLHCTVDGLYVDTDHETLRSTDDGVSWTVLQLPKEGTLFSAPDGHLFLSAYSNGRSDNYESSDGGDHWDWVNLLQSRGLVYAVGHRDWIATSGSAGHFRHRREGGTWVEQHAEGAFPIGFSAGAMTSDGTVFAGFLTVFNTPRPPLVLPPDATAWQIADLDGVVPTVNSFGVAPDGVVYVATEGYGVYRSAAPVVDRAERPANIPVASALDVYPQPARDRVTIRFNLESPAPVTLVVYDLLGRRVARLIDGEHFPPGPHEIHWGTQSVSQGTYRLVLTVSTGRSATALLVAH